MSKIHDYAAIVFFAMLFITAGYLIWHEETGGTTKQISGIIVDVYVREGKQTGDNYQKTLAVKFDDGSYVFFDLSRIQMYELECYKDMTVYAVVYVPPMGASFFFPTRHTIVGCEQ
jgi:hypothetical protein